MRPDSDKVKAITHMPSPSNVTELKQVLGLVNYVGKFLLGLSSELHPITALLRKVSGYGVGLSILPSNYIRISNASYVKYLNNIRIFSSFFYFFIISLYTPIPAYY